MHYDIEMTEISDCAAALNVPDAQSEVDVEPSRIVFSSPAELTQEPNKVVRKFLSPACCLMAVSAEESSLAYMLH